MNFRAEEVMENLKREILQKNLFLSDLTFTTLYYRNLVNELRAYADIVLFGAGRDGRAVLDILRQDRVDTVRCFCDNMIIQDECMGIKVILPEDATRSYLGACFVITAKNYRNEMLAQLMRLGVDIGNIKLFEIENTGLNLY